MKFSEVPGKKKPAACKISSRCNLLKKNCKEYKNVCIYFCNLIYNFGSVLQVDVSN